MISDDFKSNSSEQKNESISILIIGDVEIR